MTHLTITVDEDTLRRAQTRAEQQGTSLGHLLQHYLEEYADGEEERRQAVQTLLDLAARAKSGSGGRRWTRDELHER
jgi:hypothetical protein